MRESQVGSSRGRSLIFFGMTSPFRQQILDALVPADLPRYINAWVILDGARDDRIYGAVDRCPLEKCCLYSGNLPWQLQMTAPYLVQLDRDDPFAAYLIREGWGNSWGTFLQSDARLRDLRRHLRGLLRVQDEKMKRLIFRYYDPRVLRAYLPTCWPEELRTVFGPINRYLLESEDPAVMLAYGFDGRSLVENRISLQPASTSQSTS
jgi:hypothetical protein